MGETKMVLITKTWVLLLNRLNDSDHLFLNGLGVEVITEELKSIKYKNGKMFSESTTGHHIEVKTTCEKQENMLQLKYGESLLLRENWTAGMMI